VLFEYESKLGQFGVSDANFSLNGRELIKIFIKKTFHNLRGLIESILRVERENKAETNSDGYLITNGPIDLFKLLGTTYDIIKHKKVKAMVEQYLELCKESVVQYLIGVDCVIDVRFCITNLDKAIRNR
jgi:hypothetical protein